MNPKEIVESIRRLEADIWIKRGEMNSLNENLGEMLRSGKSTENRVLDLAILTKYSLNEADGQPYYDFEQALKAHPGELVALKQTWEEPMVKHVMDPGHSVSTKTVYAYLFGVIGKEGVDVSGIAGQFSYLDSLIVLCSGDSQLPEVQAPPYDALFFPNASGNWKPSLDPQNYWVGNVEVAQEVRKYRYSIFSFVQNGDELYSMLCRALGIESVGNDGQGRLAISDPNPNAPDPPPPTTD